MPPSLVAVMAHPDDIEIHVAGTLCLLKDRGFDLHFIVVCHGDCGSMVLPPNEIARIRLGEGMTAAAKIGATYDCLGVGDLRTVYSPEIKTKIVEALRRHGAQIVVTHARQDYMSDHELASALTREACFAATMPNWPTPESPYLKPLPAIPELYYADPTSQTDWTGSVAPAQFVVDIGSTIERKAELLACHETQRDWLREQHNEDNYILSMQEWGRIRGQRTGFEFGEGFTQHLGHPFPRRSTLREALGSLAIS